MGQPCWSDAGYHPMCVGIFAFLLGHDQVELLPLTFPSEGISEIDRLDMPSAAVC